MTLFLKRVFRLFKARSSKIDDKLSQMRASRTEWSSNHVVEFFHCLEMSSLSQSGSKRAKFVEWSKKWPYQTNCQNLPDQAANTYWNNNKTVWWITTQLRRGFNFFCLSSRVYHRIQFKLRDFAMFQQHLFIFSMIPC